MKMIPSRELAASPARVWQLLEKEGSIVITKDGKPRGILLPTSEETLLEDLEAQIIDRARRAVSQIRQRAAQTSVPTNIEIEREIKAVRRNRRRE
jgi:PHD/YefM family antitoxin component YafN of YafNO toxin-antitoxin module